MLQDLNVSIAQETNSNDLDCRNLFHLKISKQDLIKIIEQASTLSDRLSQEFIAQELEKERKTIENRLEKWCQVVTKGDRAKFLKRLEWDSLEKDAVVLALGDVSLVNQQSLPSWTDTLQKAMEMAGAIAEDVFSDRKQERYQYLDAENPLPFEDIYLPFIEVAKQKLAKKKGCNFDLLEEKAYLQLQFGLLKQLTKLFAKTLDLEFSLFRAYRGSQLVHLISKLQDNSDQRLYQEFIKNLLEDGLQAFFQEYSVLAKLAAIATDFWIESTAEFLQRLDSDWDKIVRTFSENTDLGKVSAIQTGLSDFHNRGRSVVIIKFTSDLKLVYKPKNLSLEQAYFDFLTWINQQNNLLPLKTLKIVNCSTHGWIEFVEALPCQTQAGVQRYYKRAGMLLSLVYALKGTDCHRENLIACGEQPVLIDLETLLHHRIWTKEENGEAISIANEKMAESVTTTALLPGVHILHLGQTQEKALDFSGLGDNNAEISVRSPKWENINTDNMAIAEEEIKVSSEKNQPFGKDLDTSIGNYIAELVTGFEQMYCFLRDRSEFLLTPDSPLTSFAQQKVRLVFRNTQLYASILQNSLDPKFLRNGVERSIELDILSRGFLSSEDKPNNWKMLAAEKQALEQLDIPYITAYSDDDAITINSEVTIEEFLDNPSYHDVKLRIKELSSENLAEQVSIIQSSFYTYTPEQKQSYSTESNTIIAREQPVSLNRENILHQVINIAKELEHKAIKGSNDSVAWLGMTHISEQKYQLRPLGYSLYDGHCGIALFLAALAKITGEARYAKLALGSLYSLRKLIWEQDKDLKIKLIKNMGIGGAKGLASVVYSFVRIAEFLDEPKLLEEALQIAAWMQVDDAVVQPKFGLVDGVAATILSLLSLHKATNKAEILEQATAWGKYLLNQRENIDVNNKIWVNTAGKLLIGCSEGIAGISHALLSLYAANQEVEFLTAGIAAIAFEQNYLLQDNSLALTKECDDLPGITLARLGSLNILDTVKIRHRFTALQRRSDPASAQDARERAPMRCLPVTAFRGQELEATLQSIERSPITPLDSLGSGNFSELEVLLLAAERLKDSEYREIAEGKIAQVLFRRDRDRGFQVLPNLPKDIFMPGFSQGTSGIGYELLRFLYPDRLPSILLWQ